MKPSERTTVLQAIRDGLATVEEICARTGLHHNTVRAQLTGLASAGLVVRSSASSGGRGRPRARFTPATTMQPTTDHDHWVDLVRTATTELVLAGYGREDTPGASAAALKGRHLAAALPPADAAATPAGSRQDLLDLLGRVGFDPSADETVITLNCCPVLQVAQELPQLACSVHEGLIRARLESSGGHWSADLSPFEEHGRCRVRLSAAADQPENTAINPSTSAATL